MVQCCVEPKPMCPYAKLYAINVKDTAVLFGNLENRINVSVLCKT